VRRESVEVRSGCRLSALVWGTGPPEIVLLHGGAQNAHTWDTVALALHRPLVAVDLPGHGHSDAGALTGGRLAPEDLAADVAGAVEALAPKDLAADVAGVVEALAPEAAGVVGMSLGGLTTLALSTVAPALVRRVVLVDVLPTLDPRGAAAIARLRGTARRASPSLRRDPGPDRGPQPQPVRGVAAAGILHNAVQRDDGSWVWRYARHRDGDLRGNRPHDAGKPSGGLWEAVVGTSPCRSC